MKVIIIVRQLDSSEARSLMSCCGEQVCVESGTGTITLSASIGLVELCDKVKTWLKENRIEIEQVCYPRFVPA